MKHWAIKYIGLPYSDEYNCWWMCRKVFREQWNILLPTIAESGNAHIIRETSRDISMRSVPVGTAPQEGDLIIMRSQIKLHAGVVVYANGHIGVLHSTSQTGVIWQTWAEAIEGMAAQLWRRQ